MERPQEAQYLITLFGGPSMRGPEGPIRLSPTQLALLTVVFGTGGVSRPEVASVLWDADDTAKIRHRIRQLLSSTNARVGIRCFDTEADRLLPDEAIACDLAAVREGLSGGNLLQSARHVVREFAPSLLTGVGGRYLDWRDEVQASLVRNVRSRAIAGWQEASHEGAWNRARDAAEALHLLDPRDAQAIAMVIEARARAGRIGSAEAAYASYVDTLANEDHVDDEVRSVIERIRRLAGPHDAQATSDAPFVGRAEALHLAHSALDRVSAGKFAFGLISGEAGIGKSRLLEEVHREAVLRGFRCLSARAVELERIIPLNPLLDAIDGLDLHPHLDALGPPWNAVINSALPAGTYDFIVGDLPPIQESGLSRRLLDSLAMLLERLAVEQPTVLFLDDLHWVDATTVTALQFFQRRWTVGPFGIIATVRPEQVKDTDPAANYLRESNDLEVLRIQLEELSDQEAMDLIDGISEGRLDSASQRRLFALSGPHPLYLTELTRDFLAGKLGLPELPADEVTIPLSLHQILRSRVTDLSEQSLRVARVLAVAARPIRLTLLAELASISLDECADCVQELQGRRLAAVERETVRIAHDLFRSALYKDIPAPRQALLHRTFAERLLEDSPDASPGELAIHFDRAGDAAKAAQHAWVAAVRAWESGAMAEAALFYELVTENESEQTRRAEATAGLARALHLNRDIARANPLLEMAASRLRAVGDDKQARRMDIRRVEGLSEVETTTPAQLVDRLGFIKAEAKTAEDWEAVALALDAELRIVRLDGDVEGVRRLLAGFRELTTSDCIRAKAVAHGGLAMGDLFDDPGQALDSAHQAVRLTTSGRADERLKALNRLLIVLYHRGMLELPQNMPMIAEARKIAQTSGDLQQRFSLECNLAAHALDSGDLDRADVLLDRAGQLLGSSDATFLRVAHAINVGELALAQRDYREAARRFEEIGRHIGHAAPRYASDLLNAGLGICALEMGSITEARRREEELGEPPGVWYYDPTTVVAFRARLLERRGRYGEALELLAHVADQIQGHLVLAWLKLRLLQTRMMLKNGLAGASALAEQGLERAAQLRLPLRVAEFEELVRWSAQTN